MPFLFDSLAHPDSSGELKKTLAKSWFYCEESYKWTVEIKKNARFHDGEPIGSDDVVFSLETILKNNRRDLTSNIEKIAPVSPLSFEIDLKEDDPGFMKKIWDFPIFKFPDGNHIDYCNAPVGSGPFVFEHREGNEKICLVANDDYYGKKPSIRRICFHYVPDKEKTWVRLLTGKTDAAPDVSTENVKIMTSYEDRFHFNHYILNQYYLVLYNTKLDLFAKPEIRQALTLAVDRKELVDKVLEGHGEIAAGPFGNRSPFRVPGAVPPLEYNPAKAMVLLEQAGWRPDERGRLFDENGKPFEFELLVDSRDNVDRETAKFLQLAWNDIGVKMRLVSCSTMALCKRFRWNDDYQSVLTWIGTPHRRPELLKKQWCIDPTRGCSGIGCLANERIDNVIRLFVDESSLDNKKKRAVEVEKAFREIHPATFLFHKASMDIMSKRIDFPLPFSLDVQGGIKLKYARFTKD